MDVENPHHQTAIDIFRIASGSARECGAVLDIVVRCAVIQTSPSKRGKNLLVRIVAMLTRKANAGRTNRVLEEGSVSRSGYVNEDEDEGNLIEGPL